MKDSISLAADADACIFAKIPEILREKLEKQGITKPTSIQQAAYEPILSGQDIIAQSRTGSGKTLAFGIPAFQRLENPKAGKPRLLVLTPTRELTTQVADVFEENFKPLGFKTLAITGGSSYRFQISNLNRGVDAIVATPGRLMDLLDQKALDLSCVEVLVLDEMDEMLDFGFADDILKIRDSVGRKVQTLLFSATFPPKVKTMSKQMVNNPHEIKIASTDTTTGHIEHEFLEVRIGKNLDALTTLLLYHAPEHAIIFCRTREETKNIHQLLLERGIAVGVLNGEMSQNDRSTTMDRFRNKLTRVLVATDVAARGIDVSGLSHVINISVPKNLETYTHRTGRTGRAGLTGKAWTLVAYNERREYQFLCSRLKLTPKRLDIPQAKKIVGQFLTNLLVNIELQSSQAPGWMGEAVNQFLGSLDEGQMRNYLSHVLKAELSRQVGPSLNVDDITPATRTEFGAALGDRVFQGASSAGGNGKGYKGGSGQKRYGNRPDYQRSAGSPSRASSPSSSSDRPKFDDRGGSNQKRKHSYSKGYGNSYPSK